MYCRHHGGDAFGLRTNLNTVAQVEDVATAAAETLQHFLHFLADALGRRLQRRGIEITLQCDFVFHAATRLA